MKGYFKSLLPILIVFLMLIGAVGAVSFAESELETVWYGDKVSVDITAGKNGYTFMPLFRKYAHGYEFSGHFLGEGEGPQTFILIDTLAHDGTKWTPSGKYVSGKSNYEVVYCCDVETMIVDSTYYKRMNLEDSDYYDDTQATRIRAILTNSYPYVTVEEMKAELKKNGYEYADDLTRNEMIAAIQVAVWACANTDGEPIRYQRSYKVSDNLQWGYPMHDTSVESGLDVSGKRVFKTYEEVGKRIDSLVDYLLSFDPVEPESEEIVITNIEVIESIPVIAQDNSYSVVLRVALNNSGSTEDDDLALDIYVGDELVKTEDVKLGKTVYDVTVNASEGQSIKAVVSGTQILPKSVYFYEPEGGRKVSQCVVGVAAGETSVYAEATITPEFPEEPPVTGTLNLQKINWRGEALTGVEFELYCVSDEVSYKIGTYAVDENGQLTVENLVSGSYELVESVAPQGYVKPAERIKFSIDEEGDLELGQSSLAFLSEEGIVVVENRLNPTKITLSGIKYLDDEVAKDFYFTLSFEGSEIKTVVSGEDGIFDFGEFFFDEEGEYVFVITEVIGDNEDIYYDNSVYTVTVTVTETDLVLDATVTVEKDGEAHEEEIRFDNFTTPDIPDNPPPLTPPTGDATTVLALIAIAALTLGFAVIGKKRLA